MTEDFMGLSENKSFEVLIESASGCPHWYIIAG